MAAAAAKQKPGRRSRDDRASSHRYGRAQADQVTVNRPFMPILFRSYLWVLLYVKVPR